ncbi:uncharacterized protein BP01DRAFT_242611 [Aspergillus saccharolyticus JOP 1030-1]|uniref:Uncharacterized protein n=1 Tax=Aspergillus saccharolyticus JOP 1030-1 TaxID=1450539 RepID=A0A318ZJJ0_9EURO|nr:hypothetical protein BP01DRAFT_242611 [Aspergillus saccharolyticus JOP 1030-1]PYH47007.1 hypothetical protein BP01DRAFT_242611 [Aspergillus saccharolyticus JOP 1030-1]
MVIRSHSSPPLYLSPDSLRISLYPYTFPLRMKSLHSGLIASVARGCGLSFISPSSSLLLHLSFFISPSSSLLLHLSLYTSYLTSVFILIYLSIESSHPIYLLKYFINIASTPSLIFHKSADAKNPPLKTSEQNTNDFIDDVINWNDETPQTIDYLNKGTPVKMTEHESKNSSPTKKVPNKKVPTKRD